VEQHVLGLDELPPFPPGFEPRLPEPEPADPPAANSLLASLSADLPVRFSFNIFLISSDEIKNNATNK
jgi:hypothetical protein